MGEIKTQKLINLIDKGPSGRLEALEFCFKNIQMNKKNQDQVRILFEALKSDIQQLEHYIVMDQEAVRAYNLRADQVFF